MLRFLFSSLIPPVLHIYSYISQGTDNGSIGSCCSKRCRLICVSEERNGLTEPPRGQPTLQRQWVLAHTFAALFVLVLYTQGVIHAAQRTEVKVQQFLYRPGQVLEVFQKFEAPRFQDDRQMKVIRLSVRCTGRLYPPSQEICLILISHRGSVDPRAIVWPEALGSSGIESATFRLVAPKPNSPPLAPRDIRAPPFIKFHPETRFVYCILPNFCKGRNSRSVTSKFVWTDCHKGYPTARNVPSIIQIWEPYKLISWTGCVSAIWLWSECL